MARRKKKNPNPNPDHETQEDHDMADTFDSLRDPQPRADDGDDHGNGDDSGGKAPRAGGGPIMLDYRGKCGPEHEHEHVAANACLKDGCDLFLLTPGLNLVDPQLWGQYKDHGPIADKLADGRLAYVKNLDSMRGASLMSLVERTESADALEAILEMEGSRKQSAGRHERRDPRIMETLERKVKARARRKTLDLSGIVAVARGKAALAANRV